MANKFLLISLGALVIGPILVVMNYQETARKKHIAAEGISAVAMPTAKIENRGRRGKRSYELDLKYPVGADSFRAARVKVSRELFDKVETEPLLEIKYLEHDPDKVWIVGEPVEAPEMYVAGGLLLVLGVAGAGFHVVRRRG